MIKNLKNSMEKLALIFKKHITNSLESNRKISAALALGIFFSYLPFFGYHTIGAMLIAEMMRLNKALAVLSTWIAAYLLIFVLPLSLVLGQFILTGMINFDFRCDQITRDFISQRIYEYIIGSIAISLFLGMISYIIFVYTLNILRPKGILEKK